MDEPLDAALNSADQATRLIREAILSGQMAPGERLKTADLAQKLGLSTMPLREALRKLEGGDAEFGPDFGGATVHTVARKAWAEECPNAAKLFKQMVFSVDQENTLMGNILNESTDPADAAKAWIEANPEPVAKWLDGVTTLDGQPGAEAVMASVK